MFHFITACVRGECCSFCRSCALLAIQHYHDGGASASSKGLYGFGCQNYFAQFGSCPQDAPADGLTATVILVVFVLPFLPFQCSVFATRGYAPASGHHAGCYKPVAELNLLAASQWLSTGTRTSVCRFTGQAVELLAAGSAVSIFPSEVTCALFLS
jgi:hypothetical protein